MRIFYEWLKVFPSPEGTRIKEGMSMRYIIPPLPGIFFSNMRRRSDNHPLPPQPFSSLSFLNSIDTRKICFYCHIFYLTFQPSTTAQSVQQNNFFVHTKFFYVHVLAEFFYVLSIILILCPTPDPTPEVN